MQAIRTLDAPRPAGHYEQAVTHGGLVFVSGQLPIEPGTPPGEEIGSIETQTRQALANVAAILDAAGTSIQRVLKVTVYIADIALWERLNAVYAEAFGDHRPARVVVPTRELHFGYQVEIEAIAALPD